MTSRLKGPNQTKCCMHAIHLKPSVLIWFIGLDVDLEMFCVVYISKIGTYSCSMYLYLHISSFVSMNLYLYAPPSGCRWFNLHSYARFYIRGDNEKVLPKYSWIRHDTKLVPYTNMKTNSQPISMSFSFCFKKALLALLRVVSLYSYLFFILAFVFVCHCDFLYRLCICIWTIE